MDSTRPFRSSCLAPKSLKRDTKTGKKAASSSSSSSDHQLLLRGDLESEDRAAEFVAQGNIRGNNKSSRINSSLKAQKRIDFPI